MKNKMPTTIILLIISWLSLVLGLAYGAYTIISAKGQVHNLIHGIVWLFLGLALAGLMRMLANTGQIVFEIKKSLDAELHNIKDKFEELSVIKGNLEQLNCDSRDINQNINDIRKFFEQIEKHLDFKK